MKPRRLLAPLVLSVLAPALPAAAASSVTMNASSTQIASGQSVTLDGATDPAVENELVQIVDVDTGAVLGSDQSDAAGAYSVVIAPAANVTVKAVAVPAESTPVEILVRPTLTVSLTNVRLFGLATVTGAIQPAHEGSVHVRLLRGGDIVVAEQDVTLRSNGFTLQLRIPKPGTYQAEISFSDDDHAPVTKRSDAKETRLPRLRKGSRGIFVLLLERRLKELKYRHPQANRTYDQKSGDAVMAFRKVQGMRRNRVVSRAVWRRLASPRIPRPRFIKPGFHIEVDQTKQVLYVVRRGKITSIIHVSTGGAGVGTTYDGKWRVWLKFPGFSPKGLYMPAFFHGQRGIHGWPDVPPTAASHGCVRVPMWTAVWIYERVDVGDIVRIYH